MNGRKAVISLVFVIVLISGMWGCSTPLSIREKEQESEHWAALPLEAWSVQPLVIPPLEQQLVVRLG
jgi:hypothetical protein